MLQTVSNGRCWDRARMDVLELAKRLRPGEMATHSQIGKLIGLKCGIDRAYYQVVASCIRYVERMTGVRLVCVRGEGYRSPETGEEQLEHGARQMKSGVRRIGCGLRTIGYVSDERLTDTGKQIRDHQIMNAKRLHELGRTTVKLANLGVGKTEVNPQRQLPQSD